MVRPGDTSKIYTLNERVYQLGWEARLSNEAWWHLNWIDASWRAGWKDAGNELEQNPELARRVTIRNKRRATIAARKKGKL